MDEWCKDLTIAQKVALPSMRRPRFSRLKERKITEIPLRCTQGLGVILRLVL